MLAAVSVFFGDKCGASAITVLGKASTYAYCHCSLF